MQGEFRAYAKRYEMRLAVSLSLLSVFCGHKIADHFPAWNHLSRQLCFYESQFAVLGRFEKLL